MTTSALNALHDIHTVTNDVLKGYREMSARAEPAIQIVILRLTKLHKRHAGGQAAEMANLRAAPDDDSSVQGTVNKVVVILRDWISDLDGDVLPAAKQREEFLLKL